MYLRQLALTNFRNYARLGLNLSPGVTVFHGENAQGKSNLLEAIHVLATSRSPRATLERELLSWSAVANGTPFARLEGRVQHDRGGAELHVEMLLRAETVEPTLGSAPISKTIKVNGLPTRAAQLVGQVNVVLFSPEDVALVAGSPNGRRRYLDIACSQVSPNYLRALQRYNRVLVQRNNLLRQVRERRQPLELLAPWNDEQIQHGALVLGERLRMIDGLNGVLAERFRQLSGTQQHLEVVYGATVLPSTVANERPDLAAAFRSRLTEVTTRELEQAVSLVGPHRDDFAFLLDRVDLNTFGSRGQQRLAALALELALAEYMQGETGERPILLLDDLLSELDPRRRAYVLDRVASGGQTLITTTDLSDLSPSFLARADRYQINAGTAAAELPASSPQP